MDRFLISALLFLLCPFLLFAKAPVKAAEQLQTKQDLCFIENKGQVKDQASNTRNDIQFKIATGNNLNIFIGNGQIHYQWNKQISSGPSNRLGMGSSQKPSVGSPLEKQGEISMYRMDVELLGADENAHVIAEQQGTYCENYFTDWSGGKTLVAHSFSKVTYKNVYPNIDWVLSVSNGQLKYEFIVKEGGKVADIQLKYGGANSLAINKDGSMSANTPMGIITEKTPLSYDANGNRVNSSFKLDGDKLSYNTGNYSGTLTIDPTLVWGTYYGGTGTDVVWATATDNSGNAYITGTTSSTSNIATVGSYQATYGGGTGTDAFIAKFSGAGALLWATYYGGNQNEESYGIASDNTGNIYITGMSTSTSGIATAGSFLSSYPGSAYEGFVAKFSTAGSIVWGTYFGVNGDNICNAITCDMAGNLYFTGYTSSTSGIATSGAYQTTLTSVHDCFLEKFSDNGSRIWGTYYGGAADDYGEGLTYNGGNIYVTGWTASTSGIATSGAFQTTFGGGQDDAFLADFTSSGSLSWGTYYGGSNIDECYTATCDGTGNIYIAGTTVSTSGIATPGAYQTSFGGGTQDVLLAKFNSSGSRVWATYLGGTGQEYCRSMTCDLSGKIYLTGTISSTGFATPGAYQSVCGGAEDAFLAAFSLAGSLNYFSYYGGSASDLGGSMARDNSGGIFIAGVTTSTAGIATPGAYQASHSASSTDDCFLAKFSTAPFVYFHQPFIDTNLCAGNALTVFDSTTITYNSGNTFTVQLSDASGNFTTPTNIGSVSATTSGTISCTIPSSTPTGTGYRIRVIGSNPADTSADNGINIRISNLAALSVTTNAPVCFSDSLYIYATDTSTGASFSWAGPNSFTAAVQNLSFTHATFVDSGSFYVTAMLGACSKTDTIHITVIPLPAAPTIGSNSPVCLGDSLLLTVSDTSAGVTYSWSGPNSFTSSLQNPSIANTVYSDSGSYDVIVTRNGCHVSALVDVTINPMPGLPTAGSNSPECWGDSLHLTATDVTVGLAYFWYGPNGFSVADQNPSIAPVDWADSGLYVVNAVLNNCITTSSVYVTIKPKPALPVINTNSPLCAGATLDLTANDSTSGVTYQLLGPNSFTSTSQTSTINNVVTADSGLYELVAGLNGCISDTAYVNVVINPVVTPSVYITTNPSPVVPGIIDQFTANITNGGTAPIIQWLKNGVNVSGPNVNPMFIFVDTGDVITVVIQSNAPCANPDTASSAGIVVGVTDVHTWAAEVKIYPNPANAVLYIDAPVKTIATISSIEGKLIFAHYPLAAHDKDPIDIRSLASGMYLIELYDENGLLIKADKFVKQ